MQIKFTALAVMLLATALAGCGGGGGGAGEGGSSSVPPPPILPDCIIYALDCNIYNRYITQGLSHEQASERTQTLSIRMINPQKPHTTEAGPAPASRLVFPKYAIDDTHPELSGKVVDNSYDEIEPGSYRQCSPNTRPSDTARSGGTAGVAISEEKRNRNARRGIRLENRIRIVSERDVQPGD